MDSLTVIDQKLRPNCSFLYRRIHTSVDPEQTVTATCTLVRYEAETVIHWQVETLCDSATGAKLKTIGL